jgi:hypothetical protein
VRVAEFHGQVVPHVCRTQHDGNDGATMLVPEKGYAVAHAHQSLVARVGAHRAGAHLHDIRIKDLHNNQISYENPKLFYASVDFLVCM